MTIKERRSIPGIIRAGLKPQSSITTIAVMASSMHAKFSRRQREKLTARAYRFHRSRWTWRRDFSLHSRDDAEKKSGKKTSGSLPHLKSLAGFAIHKATGGHDCYDGTMTMKSYTNIRSRMR